jgi:G3E family GTPase
MVHRHGQKILRVKGLLAMPGVDTPILLNAVQRFVHPPIHLDRWPDGERASRLVFITEGLKPEAVIGSLEDFLGLPRGWCSGIDRVPALDTHSIRTEN